MNCDHIIAELPDFMDNQLPAPQRAQIQAHLETCSTCTQLLADCQAVDVALSCWKVPAPQNLPTAVQLLQQAEFDRATSKNKASEPNPNSYNPSSPTTAIVSVVAAVNTPKVSIAKITASNLLAPSELATEASASPRNKPSQVSLGSMLRQWWSNWQSMYLPWAAVGALGTVILVGYSYNKFSMVATNAPSSLATAPSRKPLSAELATKPAMASADRTNSAANEEAELLAATPSVTNQQPSSPPATSSPAATKQQSATIAEQLQPNADRIAASKERINTSIKGDVEREGEGAVVGGAITGVTEEMVSNLGLQSAAEPPLPSSAESAQNSATPAAAAPATAPSIANRRADHLAKSDTTRDSSTLLKSTTPEAKVAEISKGINKNTDKEKDKENNNAKNEAARKEASKLEARPPITDTAEIIMIGPQSETDNFKDTSSDSVAKKSGKGVSKNNLTNLPAAPRPETPAKSKPKVATIVLEEIALTLAVNNLETAQNQLQRLIKNYQGELGPISSVNAEPKQVTTVKIIVYVPRKVENQFLEAVKQLGAVRKNNEGTNVLPELETQTQQLAELEAASPRNAAKIAALKAEIAQLQKRSQQTKFVIEITKAE
jgi:Putative zinc-finger